MRVLQTLAPWILSMAVATAQSPEECRQSVPKQDDPSLPLRFGTVIYRGTDPLDWMGPDEVLAHLGRFYNIERVLIAETMDPVTTEPTSRGSLTTNSSTWVSMLPTHTFDNAPDFDVLIVPGGSDARNTDMDAMLDFVRDRFPKVKYFMSVCTGAMIAARAGVLDGKRATTNKRAWLDVVRLSNTTEWIGDARWVVDGNVWTVSGVSSGTDAMLGFVRCKFGPEAARNITNIMEYNPIIDPSNDPFAVYPNGTYIDPSLTAPIGTGPA